MNRRRLVWIGIAAMAVGGVLSFLVYQALLKRMPMATVGVDVLVAASDIRPGTRIDDQSLRLAKYPAGLLPRDVLHSTERAVGHVALVHIAKGEFVLPDKLSPTIGPTSLIPIGMRAVRVRVNEFETDFFKPDSRVDVIVTGNVVGSSKPQTRFLLQDVAVLPNRTQIDPANPVGETQKTSIVTLLVLPEQAKQLTLASYEGHMKLVLRNPLDTGQEEVPPMSKPTPSDNARKNGGRPATGGTSPPTRNCSIEILHGTHKECVEGS